MDNYELHMKTHTCHGDCQNPICVAVRKAVEAEREECAKVCDAEAKILDDAFGHYLAYAIRKRGQNGL